MILWHLYYSQLFDCHIALCVPFNLLATYSSLLVYPLLKSYDRRYLPPKSSYCLLSTFIITFFVLVYFFSPYLFITSFNTKKRRRVLWYYCCPYNSSPKKFLFFSRLFVLSLKPEILLFSTLIYFYDIAGSLVSKLLFKLSIRQ